MNAVTKERTKFLMKGQIFDSKRIMKAYVGEYAIENDFEFTSIKADNTRWIICCKGKGPSIDNRPQEPCCWFLNAYPYTKDTTKWKIANYGGEKDDHSCVGLYGFSNKHASASFVAKKVSKEVERNPKMPVKDIIHLIDKEKGVQIGYLQAYRAKQFALQFMEGSDLDIYQRCDDYCIQLKQSNPGSDAFVQKHGNNSFRRMFIAFHGET